MSFAEKVPSTSDGLFTCSDLYWRATVALLAKSTARVLTVEQAKQQGGKPADFLAFGANNLLGFLPFVTHEDDWGRPLGATKGGNFWITDDHYLGLGDLHPYGREKSPQERQELLAKGIAPLHITVDTPGFRRDYDIYYPDQLEPGERLHATIYPVDQTEQQYHTPDDWPEGQPFLHRVSGGSLYELVPDPSQHANLSRIYSALGNAMLVANETRTY